MYDDLKSLLATSPVVRLIRAKSAPLILSFLHREFKMRNQIVVPHYELANRLADYLEYLEDEDILEGETTDYLVLAEKYIGTWCDEDHRYLRRYPNENGEPVIELAPYTEKAFQWISLLQKREFVGTESRFQNIRRQLQEVVDNSAEDPKKKIRELEQKRKEIARQIRQIKKTGKIKTYNDTQIKERYFNISRTARELVADFKEVEQNFRDISQNIYKKQTLQNADKGQILAYTLDATDELKTSDQGRSFYAFWQFLIADNKQDELQGLIERLYAILDERAVPAEDAFLKKIKFYLHNAGQKVIESNHLIAEKLSRTLAERNLAERRRTRELINEIKGMAVRQLGRWQGKRHFIEIEGLPDIHMPMDRPLGEPKQTATFDRQPKALPADSLEMVDFTQLFDQFEMDRQELENNIYQLLRSRKQVSLEQVIEEFPLKNGLAEIIVYLSIASSQDQHQIRREQQSVISWKTEEQYKKARMPEVIYKAPIHS